METEQAVKLAMLEKEVLRLNKRAMQRLNEGNKLAAHIGLKAAQSLLDAHPEFSHDAKYSALASVTLNNQACYYNGYYSSFIKGSNNQPNAALSLLLKVLTEYEKANNTLDYACTLLNICSILSKMKKHSTALSYVTKATEVLTVCIEEKKYSDLGPARTMLCISYYNMGAELEFLGKYPQALEEYEKGLIMAKSFFSSEHYLVGCLEDALKGANVENMRITRRHDKRSEQRVKKSVSFIKAEKGIRGNLDPILLSTVKRRNVKNKSFISQRTNISFSKASTHDPEIASPVMKGRHNFLNQKEERVFQHIRKMDSECKERITNLQEKIDNNILGTDKKFRTAYSTLETKERRRTTNLTLSRDFGTNKAAKTPTTDNSILQVYAIDHSKRKGLEYLRQKLKSRKLQYKNRNASEVPALSRKYFETIGSQIKLLEGVVKKNTRKITSSTFQ